MSEDSFSIAAYGVIENDRGQVLLTRRRGSDEWVLPGGSVELRRRLGRHVSVRCARRLASKSSSAGWSACMRSAASNQPQRMKKGEAAKNGLATCEPLPTIAPVAATSAW
jgi:hypothetical protein